MNDPIDDIRNRLDGIAEELGDLAMDRLRDRIEGDEEAAVDERRLVRARRAIEKARSLLADPATTDDW